MIILKAPSYLSYLLKFEKFRKVENSFFKYTSLKKYYHQSSSISLLSLSTLNLNQESAGGGLSFL